MVNRHGLSCQVHTRGRLELAEALGAARRGPFVFHGRPETPRLSHYFLPQALMRGRRVLYLDGANRFDPLLLARLARHGGQAPGDFSARVRVARAFTCFQLTELLARIPRILGRVRGGRAYRHRAAGIVFRRRCARARSASCISPRPCRAARLAHFAFRRCGVLRCHVLSDGAARDVPAARLAGFRCVAF